MIDDPVVVELRVHGIGNHHPWSSLGSPRRTVQKNKLVDVHPPPDAGPHVQLVNWSRTSRRRAGFIWFLALPFTLVNVVGYMRPPEGRRWQRAVLAVCSHVVGLLVSLSVCVWLIAVAETLLRHVGAINTGFAMIAAGVAGGLGFLLAILRRWRLRAFLLWAALLGVGLGTWAGNDAESRRDALSVTLGHQAVFTWTAGLIGAAFAGLVVGRHLLREENRTTWRLALPHAAVFLCVGLIAALVRPAQQPPAAWMPEWMSVPYGEGRLVDPVSLVAGITIGLALVAALVLLLTHHLTPKAGRTPNLPGAALLLCLAVLLTHAVLSIARVALSWLMAYLTWLGDIVRPGGSLMPFEWRTVLPYMDRMESVHRIDVVVAVAAAFALGLLVAIGFAVLLTRRGSGAPMHRIVQRLPKILAPLLWVTLGVLAAVFVAATVLDGTGSGTPTPWLTLLIVLLVQGLALLVALLVAGQVTPVRNALQSFSDIAGFWPVRHHPLAGASYRPEVLAGIRQAIDDSGAGHLVVVGHSQGSVLSAAVVGGQYETGRGARDVDLRLVTCGSPLATLYANFFPGGFDRALFDDVTKGCKGTWLNFWRDTDPIASDISGAVNHQLPDPPVNRKVLGHGDYWIDPQQVEAIDRLRAT